MTEQQRRFTSGSGGGLGTYRELVVGDRSWGALLGYEFYQLFCSSLPGLVGLAARRVTLPGLLGSCGRGCAVGRSVLVRQPHRIRLGDRVIVDDLAGLDVRSTAEVGDSSGIELGDNVVIGRETLLAAKGGAIELGDGCNIGRKCILATQSKIVFGESVLVAAYVYVGPGNHQLEGEGALIERPMDIRGGVTVGAHSWIGARTTILDGVTIGREAIIGAHSLVKEDVPDRAIVAGVPAKFVRFRDDLCGQEEGGKS